LDVSKASHLEDLGFPKDDLSEKNEEREKMVSEGRKRMVRGERERRRTNR